MPRVNRDIQRRMAARRERPRRTTSAPRRYQFASAPPPPVDEADASTESPLEAPAARARTGASATRTPAATPRRAIKPFSEYGPEYAYVMRDLRRIVLVVGGLLLILILLWLVFPR